MLRKARVFRSILAQTFNVPSRAHSQIELAKRRCNSRLHFSVSHTAFLGERILKFVGWFASARVNAPRSGEISRHRYPVGCNATSCELEARISVTRVHRAEVVLNEFRDGPNY